MIVKKAKSQELNRVWINEKQGMKNKVTRLYNSLYSSREPIPGEYRGVKLGDRENYYEFGDTVPTIACY